MIRGLALGFAFATGACSTPFGLFLQDLALGLIAAYAALFAYNVLFRPERLGVRGVRFNAARPGLVRKETRFHGREANQRIVGLVRHARPGRPA